jgi:hypothetical protein
MIDSPAALVEHLRHRYTLSGSGLDHVELWWKLRIDGELVVQHQSVHAERIGADLYIIVVSKLHCGQVAHDTYLEVGALLHVHGNVALTQPLVAPAHDESHLERVMCAVAEQAAVVAHARRNAARYVRCA